MRALTLIHRWLGVGFCLFFAMWFASGMVMHFVPFPALTEAERFAGLAPLQGHVLHNGLDAALRVSGLGDADRVRLIARSDGQVYIVESPSHVIAVHARDLSSAAVRSETLAVAIAADHARRREITFSAATFVELADHDQWSVPNGLDVHRPLYRIALDDNAGTELYVSSRTGEVVRDTTRRERAWNYVGSVVHWIYPTALRRNWAVWDATVWTLSLIACVAALTGAVLGLLRLQKRERRLSSPYREWHAWHHWLGIGCGLFVITWIVSGWLSMDHGRLFSTGKLTPNETRALRSEPLAKALSAGASAGVGAAAREVEWFSFGDRVYRRERLAVDRQRLVSNGGSSSSEQSFLAPEAVSAFFRTRMLACGTASIVDMDDAYAIRPAMPHAPVYRVVCGDTWLHIDGANGAMLEKLDPSRRAYRWAYSALHTFDYPALTKRPALRTAIIVLLCAAGLAFSVTAVVIGWRRLF